MRVRWYHVPALTVLGLLAVLRDALAFVLHPIRRSESLDSWNDKYRHDRTEE